MAKNELTDMQKLAIKDTLQRLNWLYGRGEIQSIDFDECKVIAKSPYCEPHRFFFKFDGINCVKTLRHKSRLRSTLQIRGR